MLMSHYLAKTFKYVSILILVLFLSNTLFAQISVRGKVTDNANQPLPMVSVTVKETSAGTTTNLEGEFTLTVPSQKSVLIFSYIGFPTQQVTVGNQTTINLALSPNAGQLNEVVVTGYGTQKRGKLPVPLQRSMQNNLIKEI